MNICITFDYELYFGDNYGTYDEVLFRPTYALIDALDTKGVSATFFADVCSIPMAKKYEQEFYLDGFGRQLRYMKQHGQDVQLHLHPHWYNAKWNEGRWSFSNQGYRLHDFTEDKLNQIIADGIQYLKDTLVPVDQSYECIAYRAGGFSLQPHESIVAALYDNGIRVDSSIAPQLYTESEAQFYDYRHKLEKMNWHISDVAEWWQDSMAEKHLFEIPIASIDKAMIPFVLRRFFASDTVKLNLGPKRGSYITIHTKPESMFKKYYNYFTGYNAISMDAYTAEFMYTQTKRLYKKNECDNQTTAVIGHPKLVTEKYIDNLCRYIDLINHDSRFELISIFDAYKRMETRVRVDSSSNASKD